MKREEELAPACLYEEDSRWPGTSAGGSSWRANAHWRSDVSHGGFFHSVDEEEGGGRCRCLDGDVVLSAQ